MAPALPPGKAVLYDRRVWILRHKPLVGDCMTPPVNRGALFFGACGGLFIYGTVLALLGTMFGLAEMRQRLPLDFARQGHLILLLYLGVLITTFLAGPLSDSLGFKWVLVIAALLVTAGQIGFAVARSFGAAVPAALLMGFGGGGLCIGSNGLVSELYPERRSAMLNLLGVAFGVGAFALPLLMLGLEGRCSAPQLLGASAAVALLFSFFFALSRFPEARERHGVSILETLKVIKYPGLLAIAMLLFFESGNEACMGGWTSVYAGHAGLSARAATLALSGYWAGMMFGRLVAPLALRRWGRQETILAGALGSVLGCALLLGAHSFATLAPAAFLCGFSFAPVFQTALGIAGDRYTQSSSSVMALLFLFALVSGMAFPWSVGQISQALTRHGYAPIHAVRGGLLLPLAGTVCVSVLAGVQVVRARRRRASAESTNA